MKARAFVVSKETGEPISGVAVTATWQIDGEAIPVALLASDDAGYVSFDLADQAGDLFLEVSPGDEGRPANWNGRTRVQIKAAGRTEENGQITLLEDPVVLAVDPLTVRRPKTITRPSVQAPDVRDWELSPTSFVTRRSITLGEGGCAVPVRSVLPLRRIRFVQIARQSVDPVRGGDDAIVGGVPATARTMLPTPPPGQPAIDLVTLDPFESPVDTISQAALPCTILEYEQEWSDLGETLGNVLYSLPLAPCESVDVAVIEAARQDQIQRQDDVTSREELDHSIFRDRTIDESVEGALRERQGGWSLMGGHAGSYSGSWANVGTFSAIHSLGGAISHSWGNRDVEAESNQELHDAVVQATDVVRTLNSSVVVAASQTERHQLETRTVTNHNHCHALTVQYYEVLRRLKLTTSFLRVRAGILIPYEYLTFAKTHPVVTDVKPELGPSYKFIAPPEDADLRLVNRLRPQLEGSLLNPALDANFEAVRRLLFFSLAELPKPSAPGRKPGDYDVNTLIITIRRGRWGTGENAVSLRLRLTQEVGTGSRLTNYVEFDHSPTQRVTDTKDPTRVLLSSLSLRDDLDDDGDTEAIGPWTIKLRRPISRLLLAAAEIHWVMPPDLDLKPDFLLAGVEIRTPSPTGEEVLVDEEPKHRFQRAGFVPLSISAPKVDPATTSTDKTPDLAEEQRKRRAQDEALAWELITHLYDHRDYYSQGIIATKDSAWFAEALDAALGVKSPVRERIDGAPVAVSGRYVAFTTDAELPARPNGKLPKPKPKATDIVTLPTRGVLAEAQLGSCNACEKRDVTRFWQWEESPCEQPPEIQGITPGFRGQTPKLEPTALPNAVVQITQPPAAPDPTGLAAALTLLGKGDAFRDMSGLKEVQTLLSDLAEGAVSLADARKRAAAASAKLAEGAAASDGAGAGAAPKQTPAERYDNLQVAREVAAQAEKLGWSPQTTEAVTSAILGGGPPPGGLADVVKPVTINLDKYAGPEVRAFGPGNAAAGRARDNSGRTSLRAVVNNAPAGSTWQWTVADPAKAQIVTPSAHITDVVAGHPGLVDLTFTARDPAKAVLATVTTKLTVPQFVVIGEQAAAFNAELAAYRLGDVKAAVLGRVKLVVEHLLQTCNVRTIWTLAPFGETVPAQFQPGGFAAGKYSTLTIRGTNAGDPGTAGSVAPAGVGAAKPDEPIDVWPGAYRTPGTDVGIGVASVVTKVSGLNMTDPQLKTLWIEIMGRLIGETVAHEICHSLLGFAIPTGHNSPAIPWDLMNRGTERSLLQRTGIEVIDPVKFPDPGSYRDGGVAAISGLMSLNQGRIDTVFPVPPAFV